nr:glycoside hydrolase family 25 protein [Bifidobacterium stellenboschense]
MSRMARAVRVTVASVAAAAMLGAVCVAPASALADVNADAATTATGVASGATASTINGAQSTTDASVAGATVSAFKTQTVADASDDADAMPENPNAALPDKVSSEISDDATVVSEQYAATPEGELKDIETGETVTDPKIVGTESKQPDPLAKTDGESFIPVSAADVKEKVAANGGDVNADADATDDANGANDADGAGNADGNGNADAGASGNADGDATMQQDDSASQQSVDPSAQRRSGAADGAAGSRSSVKLAALQNNEYGAHWGSYNGTQAFFDAHNNLFAQQAKGVIDVSTWQGTIDWQAAKNAGVEGAIIRLSFGWGNGFDAQARRNISECKRLGIPFGVYVFSYAESAADGASEGADVVNLLRQAGVNPGDLSYPVFYDLETWTYTGHKNPTNPNVYDGMVNAWYAKLQAAGYSNLSVYSYTSFLNNELNSASIHAKTRWVAQYGSTMQYTAFPTNDRGWQYTSGGTINGISGRVDLNAFGNYQFTPAVQMTWVYRSEDIAVGASADYSSSNIDYKWQAYNLSTKRWKTIADWTGANWASWVDSLGDYWLHLEARDSRTHKIIGSQTIAFRYAPGTTRVAATYAGWQNGHVLLGESSNNASAHYEMKIYDVKRSKWVQGFKGQWAIWKPKKGIYWTHYEVYTSDGRLADTKTYAFGV